MPAPLLTSDDRTEEAVAHLLPLAKAHAVVEGEEQDAYLSDLIRAEIARAASLGVVLLSGTYAWSITAPSAAPGIAPSIALPFGSATVGAVTDADDVVLAPGPDYQAGGARLWLAPRLAGQTLSVTLSAGLASDEDALPADLAHGLVRRVATQYAMREDVAVGTVLARLDAESGSSAGYLAPYLPLPL